METFSYRVASADSLKSPTSIGNNLLSFPAILSLRLYEQSWHWRMRPKWIVSHGDLRKPPDGAGGPSTLMEVAAFASVAKALPATAAASKLSIDLRLCAGISSLSWATETTTAGFLAHTETLLLPLEPQLRTRALEAFTNDPSRIACEAPHRPASATALAIVAIYRASPLLFLQEGKQATGECALEKQTHKTHSPLSTQAIFGQHLVALGAGISGQVDLYFHW